jgi:uncharacterized protein (DUF2141 family)
MHMKPLLVLRYAAAAAMLIGSIGALHGTARSAPLTTLSVTVAGFRGREGQAIVALYDAPERWLALDRAAQVRRVPITDSALTVQFAELKPGTYAVSVFHDRNGNGKLDMRYFPRPRPAEGAGVSNDAFRAFGPPSWNGARFTLAERDTAMTLRLRY